MKKLLDESEKERIKLLYESKGILLSEETIWGALAKKALSWVGKNEDDIALLFKTTEKTLAKSIDDIVEVATKAKSVEQLDDIQMKLMHFYNPSGLSTNVPKAQQQMKNFLNGTCILLKLLAGTESFPGRSVSLKNHGFDINKFQAHNRNG